MLFSQSPERDGMTVLIEDSPRNLLSWIERALQEGHAQGAVISPFASPAVAKPHRRSAAMMAERLLGLGGQVFFDPTTHALDFPQAGDFRYYDEYPLWSGPRGLLSTAPERRDHVQNVFSIQDDLRLPHLAPTLLLHTPTSPESERALQLSRTAVEEDAECWLAIAGDGQFWSGEALDAHIGALAQLEPGGWFLTVARGTGVLPVPAEQDEVAGLCRTARALSEYAPVHISHGDLAALPAVAAGATSIGTGWDQRQRMFSYAHYMERGTGAEGGGWYDRPTLQGALGLLKRPEVELLLSQDRTRAERLLPGPIPPGTDGVFHHHVEVLDAVTTDLLSQPDPRTLKGTKTCDRISDQASRSITLL